MNFSILILSILIGWVMLPQKDKYSSLRERMVKVQILDRGITDKETLSAMRKVPRHLFVPPDIMDQAYDDNPLPIGSGQTISQPYIVAFMTEVCRPTKKTKVLEIGTGSGYQAAIFAEIVDTVYTIEIIQELVDSSSEKLRQLGYKNIIQKAGDGYNGWPEHAPYDIIVVTAAANEIPKPLINQLAENGRLVIPVGQPWLVQELILLVKKNGKIEESRLASVRFVPFKRSKN